MTVSPTGYVQYFLDGVQLGSFNEVNLPEPISRSLEGLSEGIHTLHVFAYNQFIYMAGNPSAVDRFVNFTIDALPPAISIVTMPREIVDENELPLKLSVTEQVASVECSIDEKLNAPLTGLTQTPNGNRFTVTGNASLEGLQGGQHNITIYATDTAGSMGASQTLQFTTAQTTQTPSPAQTPTPALSPSPSQSPPSSPTPEAHPIAIDVMAYIFAGILVIVVISLLVFVYFKRLRNS